ncbi:hypothetical protein [Amycolatopsis sp. RTGN1]|uniref:hypothetical protein n=1 Tax=Amycolatopsis ponsaeliensis TaxID=2992142 RepID=UPI00254D8B46|nr:hypothetical protein [Amycolatopsis sp. RTGN1]
MTPTSRRRHAPGVVAASFPEAAPTGRARAGTDLPLWSFALTPARTTPVGVPGRVSSPEAAPTSQARVHPTGTTRKTAEAKA